MLQINKSPAPTLDQGPSASDAASLAEHYTFFLALVRQQFPVMLFVLLLTIGLGAVYLFTTPPKYTGTAELIIDTHKLQLFQQSAARSRPSGQFGCGR